MLVSAGMSFGLVSGGSSAGCPTQKHRRGLGFMGFQDLGNLDVGGFTVLSFRVVRFTTDFGLRVGPRASAGGGDIAREIQLTWLGMPSRVEG